jgi:hypothetical protein
MFLRFTAISGSQRLSDTKAVLLLATVVLHATFP